MHPTRLQKIAYLLEVKGLGFGLTFDYHNFGPFSSDLAFAIDDAEALGYLETEERPGFHAVPYTIFHSLPGSPEFKGDEKFSDREAVVATMKMYSALVLELAATAVYLKGNGYENSFWEEVKKRKKLKATGPRLEAARKLIRSLGL